MRNDKETAVSAQSPKLRKGRNREVSSRFQSSTSASILETGIAPSSEAISLIRRKTVSDSTDIGKRWSVDDPGFIRDPQLWPSASPAASYVKKNAGTLSYHLGDDRFREYLDRKTNEKSSKGSSIFSLSRRISYRELPRIENDRDNSKENDRPIIGGSMRLTGKLGIEVPSKYMNDVSTTARRLSLDITAPKSLSSDNSPMIKKFTIKSAIKRANSLTGYKSSKSQWALSPGRSASPPISVESKEKPTSFSSLKPSTSPSKVKGVEKFLNMGFDFFKRKTTSLKPTPTWLGNLKAIHELRLLDNRLIQWRYANARAESANKSISNQAESNLLRACEGIQKLQHSMRQKKLQYEKEKLQMKLNFILYSQIKLLEAWGDLERQHLSAITATKDCLHSVVCRVPLIERAKVDIPSASIVLRHASELTASIKSTLTSLSPSANKAAALLSELAVVVTQERLLLEEFTDLFQTLSVLEIQERSLKCSFIQFDHWQQQIRQQKLLTDFFIGPNVHKIISLLISSEERISADLNIN